MKILLLLCLFGNVVFEISAVLARKNCDKLGVRLYEDMGCTPKYNPRSKDCPEEFICPHLHESTKECYYKNLTIKTGEAVRNHPDQLCDIGCFCTEEAKFICAIVDCAEYFGITPPPGCYSTYDLEHCCSSGQKCDDCRLTCEYNGEKYDEGLRFYPKDSCSMCVCQEGFKAKIEAPFCTRSKCNVQLKDSESIQKRCAPVYNLYSNSGTSKDVLCCPNEWICPSGNETIIGTPKSNKICYFGKRNLKLGQKIEKSIRSIPVICECQIPPLLTCVPKK